MTSPTIRVHQIYFRPAQQRHLDPDFLPYDNTANPHPEWAEYHVFRTAHAAGLTQAGDLVGFVSWRFGAKTGIAGRQFLDFIAAHPGHDAYFINPFPHIAHMYRNPWIGLEDQQPGALAFVQHALDAAGYHVALGALPNDPETAAYSNYWAGTPAFWQRYLAFTEPLYRHLESGLTLQQREFLHGRANYSSESSLHPFIMERMFPTLLQTEPGIRALRYVHPPAEAAYGVADFVAERERVLAEGGGQNPRLVAARVEVARDNFRDRVIAADQPLLIRQRRKALLKRLLRPATALPTAGLIAAKVADRLQNRALRGPRAMRRKRLLVRGRIADPGSLIISQEEGAVPLASAARLCVYAHFDRQERIDPYVVHMLRAYQAIGCATVFVTTCEGLAASELAKVRPHVARSIVRRNLGHDFGSHAVALHSVGDLAPYAQVVLTNDSIYGPLHDLQAMFSGMANRPLDIWGAVDSWELGYHLQSYFLVFNSSALRHSFFPTFWRHFSFLRERQVIIDEFELGLSRRTRAAGLRIGAYCEYKLVRALHVAALGGRLAEHGLDVRRVLYESLNPTHWFWDSLIEQAGCPFLKVDLLRDNFLNLPSVPRWPEVVGRVRPELVELIANHLKRVR